MIDKLAINNELILMKTEILPAKLTVTRKLVKRLKECKVKLDKCDEKLSTKKGNIQKKIDKTVNLIEYLKHTTPRELAGLLLTTIKDPKKVITNASASVSELAVAHLGGFKKITDKLADIKTRHSLDENDEEWRKRILEHGKNKKIKLQKEAHKKLNKQRKNQERDHKNREKKRLEWLKKNTNATEEEDDDNGANSNDDESVGNNSGSIIVNEDESDDDNNSNKDSSENDDDNNELDQGSDDENDSEPESDESDDHNSEDEDSDEKELIMKNKATLKNVANNIKTNTIKNVAIKKVESSKIMPRKPPVKTKNSSTIVQSSKPTKEPSKKVKPSKTVDPFFVVGTGDNYMSSVVIDRKQEEPSIVSAYPENNKNRAQKRAGGGADWWNSNKANVNSQDKRGNNRSQGGGIPSKVARFEKMVPNKSKPVANGRFEKPTANVSSFARKDKSATPVAAEKELHPSWVAKQKLKPTITEFKGSKIVFSDD